jgi:hypothetical protein
MWNSQYLYFQKDTWIEKYFKYKTKEFDLHQHQYQLKNLFTIVEIRVFTLKMYVRNNYKKVRLY